MENSLVVNVHELSSDESNILNLSLCIDNQSMYIYYIYRSSAGNTNDFIAHLRNILDNENTDIGCCITGDINLDIIGNTNHDYLDILAEHGFKSFVNIFTRLPPNAVYSCLDHIFIKTTKSNLDS